MHYYSENWNQATEKFYKQSAKFAPVHWCVAKNHNYDIPYVMIGDGPHKIVINSGIHGIEGYFGSGAQIFFLDRIAPHLSGNVLKKFCIVLIHVINGWGMENRMREVRDKNGGLVDLNRNFGIDFTNPGALPINPKYALAHDLLISRPDAVAKKNAIKQFRNAHLTDGVWDAIGHGQYEYPYGLFYGGVEPATENRMTMHIYDRIMTPDAQSLTSIGLHTGLGRFNRRRGRVSAQLLVSHPATHKNTRYFQNLFWATAVIPDENAVFGPTLRGDLVDCLEMRYGPRNIPIYTADFEIGTGEFPIMSPIYKRMDMGDARYDLIHYGRINDTTRRNLTESWYPSDSRWRDAALERAYILFREFMHRLNEMATHTDAK